LIHHANSAFAKWWQARGRNGQTVFCGIAETYLHGQVYFIALSIVHLRKRLTKRSDATGLSVFMEI